MTDTKRETKDEIAVVPEIELDSPTSQKVKKYRAVVGHFDPDQPASSNLDRMAGTGSMISKIALANEVKSARLRLFGSVEQAIRRAGVNRATWQRGEDAKPVRDDSLVKIESALQWMPGTAFGILEATEGFGGTLASDEPVDDYDAVARAIERTSILPQFKRLLIVQLDAMREEASRFSR